MTVDLRPDAPSSARELLVGAVSRLCDRYRLFVERDPVVDSRHAAGQPRAATTRYVTMPGLLEQVAGLLGGERISDPARSTPGPRTVLDLDAADLLATITGGSRWLTDGYDIRVETRTADGRTVTLTAATELGAVSHRLRAVAAHGWTDPPVLDAVAGLVGAWAASADGLLRSRLGDGIPGEVRGVPCPRCGTTQLFRNRGDGTREIHWPLRKVQRPADLGSGVTGVRCGGLANDPDGHGNLRPCDGEWSGERELLDLSDELRATFPEALYWTEIGEVLAEGIGADHGSRTRYNRDRCRCDECRAGNAARQSATRANRRDRRDGEPA